MFSVFDHQAVVVDIAVFLTLAIGGVVTTISLLLLVYHRRSHRRRTRFERDLVQASYYLAPPLVSGSEFSNAIVEARRRWGQKVIASVLMRARLTLKGLPELRAAAALEELGEVDRLSALAGSRLVWLRSHAFRMLGRCGGSRAREALRRGVADRHAGVRRVVRRALLALRDSQATDLAVASYLEDSERDALADRWFFGLLAYRSPKKLADLVEDGRLHAREEKQALEALADAGDPAVVPLAAARAVGANAELRASGARALGKVHSPLALPVLTGLLSDSEWFVRASAARALGGLDCGEVGRRGLLRCLSDSDWWVRTNAAMSLSRQGDAGLRMLLEVLEGGGERARGAALPTLSFARMSPTQLGRLSALLDQTVFQEYDALSIDFLRVNPAFERQ